MGRLFRAAVRETATSRRAALFFPKDKDMLTRKIA
jgi:hypothetical protein